MTCRHIVERKNDNSRTVVIHTVNALYVFQIKIDLFFPHNRSFNVLTGTFKKTKN
uniref:Uncharacterized protein n=1 Tax=Anguilla anguilla TaxID=7936 RepID=A0A0E9Y184_ANGAN